MLSGLRGSDGGLRQKQTRVTDERAVVTGAL